MPETKLTGVILLEEPNVGSESAAAVQSKGRRTDARSACDEVYLCVSE